MKKYDHKKIEAKWQKYWDSHKTFAAKDVDKRPKKYILDMFPYPSGAGLHVGHPEGYTATDILSRQARMKDFNVLHPMGWDAFGLPAENYAIKMGVHPQKTTEKNIKRFKEQIKAIGLSYDWSRELNTSSPDYYKWTQWLFLQLYKKGLAYKKEASVNWCPKDNTVLANEQVINGACERCGTTVVQKLLSQWFFKITDYAEELLSDLDKLDWPEPIKLMQRNWIGKSMGAEIDFVIKQPLVKRFVLLHGKGGSPKDNAIPWLRQELEKKGFEVETPALPNPGAPDDVEQTEYALKNCKFDETTVVLGHSFGGVVGLRLLEKGVKMNRLILAATPFTGEFLDGKKRPTVTAALQKGFDFSTIKRNALGFTLVYDMSDYVVPVSDGEALAEKLGFGVLKVKGSTPHFSDKQEPELLAVALGSIKVFTTRPDTLFGATYLVLAPEHPLVKVSAMHLPNSKEILAYVEATKKKSELQRTQLEKEKTGVELKGIKVINPATKEELSVWIADYVITGYGTGAVMAVPAHDQRDFDFAKAMNMAGVFKYVVSKDKTVPSELKEAYTAEGFLINSGEYNGLFWKEAIEKIGSKFGTLTTKYKLRDWLVSRQRYWGAPIPIIYCPKCGQQPVPENSLPVMLPTDVDFRPTGESPLKRSKKFSKVSCPKCKGKAERDYDTMDTFVDSSWYFLRYADPKNKTKFTDKKKMQKWLPVDVYVGGAEHAVLHLLYSRFVTKALRDFGILNFSEPFTSLHNQGLILGPDGEKMSKSRGNVVNPDDVIKEFGADSLRLYEMFMGPLEDSKPWQTLGIVGVKRFLDKVYDLSNLVKNLSFAETDNSIEVALHRTIKKVTEDIENFRFNTAISSFMIFMNDLYKLRNELVHSPQSSERKMVGLGVRAMGKMISIKDFRTFLTLLYPFAPHLSEELNQSLGGKKSLQMEKWPEFKEELTVDSTVEIIVQVNGKVKGKLSVARNAEQKVVETEALKLEPVKALLANGTVKKTIYVPNRILNLVV